MLLRCVAKLFALEPKANAIETSIITLLILSALLSTVFAMGDTLASLYTATFGDTVIGAR